MRIGKVIGTVTLSRQHPSMTGATLKLVSLITWDELLQREGDRAEETVVFDELGAGIGSQIALSEGREASMPFYPEVKPIDAYNAAILDTLEFELPDCEQ